MEILVVDNTAKVFYLECESTDTIAHLRAKLKKIAGNPTYYRSEMMFNGKRLGSQFSENMTLDAVGIQDGSIILDLSEELMGACGVLERPQQGPEKDDLHYADAFKDGWKDKHAETLLRLLLELCHDGTISEGNVTDEAWLRIHNSLKNSMQCSFEIEFLKERLRDYRKLYSVLTETSSPIFNWDREKKRVTIMKEVWRKEFPVLLLLCGEHIPYFDILEKLCLLLNAEQSSEQRVSESSTNISTMHVNQVGQDLPRHSKLRSLFCMCSQS